MRTSESVDNLVFDWNGFQQETFDLVRQMVLNANDAIQESIKYNVPFYSLNGLLIYVSPLRDGNLYLAFCQGDKMLDTEGLFLADDTTKRVRKVHFRNGDSVNWESVQAYIYEGIEINLIQRSFSRTKKPR